MTPEWKEKKAICLKIISLLNHCDGCLARSKERASIEVQAVPSVITFNNLPANYNVKTNTLI